MGAPVETWLSGRGSGVGMDRPFEHLKRQGRRYRTLGAALVQGCHGQPISRTDARAMHRSICLELPFDLQLRQQVVLPMLARRAEADDDFERLRETLALEYRELYLLCEPIGRALHTMARGRALRIEPFQASARDFADRADRAFALENSVMLPLARVRLTQADREELSASLKANLRLKLAARSGE